MVYTLYIESGFMKSIYLIKDLAVKTGLSIYTIKYYIRRGLIKEIGRSPDTNFRYFDDSTVEKLRLIRDLRRERLSLENIKKRMAVKEKI